MCIRDRYSTCARVVPEERLGIAGVVGMVQPRLSWNDGVTDAVKDRKTQRETKIDSELLNTMGGVPMSSH